MKIEYHPSFIKHFKKRIHQNKNLDQKFAEMGLLFMRNPKDIILKDHGLTGQLKKFRSFSITGDVRVIYRIRGNVIEFYDIGTHNQVY